MSPEKDWTLRVRHILDAIGKIQRYTVEMDEAAFRDDERTADAVIRNFLVIGEATRHVPKEVRERHPEIPWPLMEGMRHVLVHDYNMIRLEIVWKTVQESLPPLIQPLQALLGKRP